MTIPARPSVHEVGPLAPSLPVGSVRTVANVVTALRTLVGVVVAGVAISADVPWLLAVAYGVYWFGDMADGWFARRLDQETRLGAVFDIISDRACTSILCIGLLAYLPRIAPVAIVFFLSFMVLDTMLSLAFLCWPLLSPNYFHEVDALVYKVNWSPPAKAVNTTAVVLLAVFGPIELALLVTLLLVAVKSWSAVRVLRLLDRAPR